MGRPVLRALKLSGMVRVFRGGRAPKDVAGKDDKGMRLMGESGEEDGEGSDKEDESVMDRVVVGDDSADSEACVDVLSWCLWWIESEGIVAGRRCCEGMGFPSDGAHEVSISIILGLTTVTVSRSAMVSASRSKTAMKGGI